ncbi:MAG TPA: hypothetical protein VGJ63_22180 [Micromonosporaceae bacterium]
MREMHAGPAEADGTQVDRREPLQRRLGIDQVREQQSLAQVLPDRGSERLEPVVPQRQPELERPEPTRRLQRLIEEGVRLDAVLAEWLDVPSLERERPSGGGRIAVQQHPAVQRLVEPLVRVERQRVGLVESGEGLGHGERGRHAVRPVDVQPQVVLLGDGGDVR